MKRSFRWGFALATVSSVLFATPANAQWAHLVLDSEQGDTIGGGLDWDIWYTPATSDFWFAYVNNNVTGAPAFLTFNLGAVASGPDDTLLGASFSSSAMGQPLTVGTYLDAERAAFASAGHPGLDVSFQNRGSNTVTGWFEVESILYHADATALNGFVIDYFRVNFEQHSEGLEPALFGTFEYSAVPEPATALALAPVLLLMRRRKANS